MFRGTGEKTTTHDGQRTERIKREKMKFFSIFKRQKNEQNILVTERRQSMLHDTAAAVAFSDEGEHETARSIIDRTRGNRTILMIVNGDSCSETLKDYALEMAKRLDYKLLALHVTESPLSLSEESRKAIISDFRESCRHSVKTLRKKAEQIGVSFSNVIECGNSDDIVAKLHARYPGMRYVLTEPDPEIVRSDAGHAAAVPVFDLGCFQPSAA